MPFFFFNDTATTEIYTLSLHDALPISREAVEVETVLNFEVEPWRRRLRRRSCHWPHEDGDRKSTRLNSSHLVISYAVFCLKKKTASATPRDSVRNVDVVLALFQPSVWS